MGDPNGGVNLADLSENQEVDVCPFLPADVLKEIFCFFSEDYLRHLRLVNRQWFNVINLNNFTIGLVREDEFSELIQTFSRYSTLINLNFAKSTLFNNRVDELTLLTQLHSLTFTNLFNWQHFSSLPNLRSLEVDSLTGDVLPYLTQLTRLVVSTITELSFPKENEGLGDGSTLPLLVNLKELSVKCIAFVEYTKKLLEECTNRTRLIIKSLDYDDYPLDLAWENWTQLEEMNVPFINTGSWSRRKKPWTLTNLKILKEYEVPPYITMMTKLESLEVDEHLDKAIHQLPASLKSLKYEYLYFDASEFTRLTNLEMLHFWCEDIPGKTSEFTRLTKLKNLQVFCRILMDFFPFMEMPHLTALKFSATQVENFQSISVLTNLQELDLSDTSDEISIAILTSLHNLTSLRTPRLRLGFKYLNVSNLTRLHFLHSEKTNQIIGLETCTALTYLFAPIEPRQFSCLAYLTKLRSLDTGVGIGQLDKGEEPEFVEEKELQCISSKYLTRLTIATNDVMALTRLSKLQDLHVYGPVEKVEDLHRHFSYMVDLSANKGCWSYEDGWFLI